MVYCSLVDQLFYMIVNDDLRINELFPPVAGLKLPRKPL